ncbi:hypothetical protein AGMMS49942_17420 [Spirochaetia bacterium]|nr:hypothetical protein AGMMS49942_17420 [Spirochaetia bacterium]
MDIISEVNWAVEHVREGDYDTALADYERITRVHPESTDGWNSCGLFYHNAGDYDKAITCFTKGVELRPEFPFFWSNRAISYGEKGDFDKALADFDHALHLDPENTWVFEHRSDVYGKMGDWGRALAELDRAISLEPENSRLFGARGAAYNRLGNKEQAIADYTEAIRLNPDDAYFRFNRGLIHWYITTTTDFDLAMEDFTATIERAPDMADAHYARGYGYMLQIKGFQGTITAVVTEKVQDEAIRAVLLTELAQVGYNEMIPWMDNLYKTLRLPRDRLDSLMIESASLLTKYSLGEALEDLDRAITLNPAHDKAYLCRGHVYRMAGDKERAVADYEQVLTLVPHHNEAQKQLDALMVALS